MGFLLLWALSWMISPIFIPQDWPKDSTIKHFWFYLFLLSRVWNWIRQWRLCPRAGGTGLRTDTDSAGSGRLCYLLTSAETWSNEAPLFCDDHHIDFRSSECTEAIFLSWEDWESHERIFKPGQCLQLNVRDVFVPAGSSCWDWWRTRQQSQTEPEWKEGKKSESFSTFPPFIHRLMWRANDLNSFLSSRQCQSSVSGR